ncbi:MAG TPA: hypothetical protein VN954_02855 [Ktedonobacteraceae bacterium]|nr:hypothetical protein [Ktedonobacteraceae bacterium]
MAISQSRPRPNILIQSSEGYPIAVVEVKNQQNLSRDIATKFRRNMLAHGLLAQIPYFLLASQDVGYLWKEPKYVSYNTPPNYEFPMDKVVTRYLKREPGQRLYGAELELVVLQWLTDLTQGTQENVEEPEITLSISGFIESIKGATVLAEEEI